MTSSTSSAIGTGSRIGALATVSIVAGKEFRDCLRSRWLVFGSALFAILGLAVFFGTAAIGGTLQYQPLPSVMNSLLSLTVFLLPLLALPLQGAVSFLPQLFGGRAVTLGVAGRQLFHNRGGQTGVGQGHHCTGAAAQRRKSSQ